MFASRIIAAAILILACVAPFAEARAQQAFAPGEFRIYEENDFFNPFTEQTDRYYTQGLRVEWLRPSDKSDSRFLPGIDHQAWCRLFCGSGAESAPVNTGFAVGQNIYTPANIEIAAPQPFDRPWAGMLYVSRIARVRYKEDRLGAEREDKIEASLGIVGPASLAKQAQTAWHEVISAPRPRGWDHQLKNEPVVQLRYETALRWPDSDRANADLIPRIRGSLGNAVTSLEVEVTGRVGWNLSGFGVGTIGPAAPPPAPAAFAMMRRDDGAGRERTKWFESGNLFLRAGLKAVAHNITLDGNSFADDDIRIDRKLLVPEIAAGVELNLVGNFWMTAQFIHRGSEFKSRLRGDAPAQEFGAITFAWITGD